MAYSNHILELERLLQAAQTEQKKLADTLSQQRKVRRRTEIAKQRMRDLTCIPRRQQLVASAIIALSPSCTADAAVYVAQWMQKVRHIGLTEEELQRLHGLTGDWFLALAANDLMDILADQPERLSQVRAEALKFLCESKAYEFTKDLNVSHGVVPTSDRIVDQMVSNDGLSECIKNSILNTPGYYRSVARRWRLRWGVKLGSAPPQVVVGKDELTAKAQFLQKSSARKKTHSDQNVGGAGVRS